MCDLEAFLAGECPDHVGIYLAAETFTERGSIERLGEAVPGGIALVVEGDRGRAAFETAIGVDPMAFARSAGDRSGTVDRELTGGTCPEDPAGDDEDGGERDAADAGDSAVHDARVIFAFVQSRLEDAEGLYAEGDVMHAYVRCACGVEYSEKWLIDA